MHPFRRVDELHFELTQNCNLRCRYCYNGDFHKNQPSIELPTVEFACGEVFENSERDRIGVVLYGGEVLTLTPAQLEAVFERIEAVAATYNKSVTFGIQSNLTIPVSPYLGILQRFGVRVSSSLDGITPTANGSRGPILPVLENLELLSANSVLGGIICVVDKHNAGEISHFLSVLRQKGIRMFSHTIRRSVGACRDWGPVDAESIHLAECQILDHMIKWGRSGVLDREILLKLHRFFGEHEDNRLENNYSCFDPFCGAGLRIVTVNAEGKYYPCGCATSTPSELGRVAQFDHANYSMKAVSFHEGIRYFEECHSCSANRICFFGCVAFDADDLEGKRQICKANKMLFQLLEEKEADLIEVRELASEYCSLRAG